MRTPHLEYLRLAVGESARRQKYRTLFRAHVDEDLISDIRKALNKGLAPGDDRFKDQIEALTGRRVRPARMGRPKKDRIEKNPGHRSSKKSVYVFFNENKVSF